MNRVRNTCRLLQCLLRKEAGFVPPVPTAPVTANAAAPVPTDGAAPAAGQGGPKGTDPARDQLRTMLNLAFTFAFVWGVGGALHAGCREAFDQWLKDTFEGILVPSTGIAYDYYVDFAARALVPWQAPSFKARFPRPFPPPPPPSPLIPHRLLPPW